MWRKRVSNLEIFVSLFLLLQFASATILPSQDGCGESSSSRGRSRFRRIVGGTELEHGEHPWLVGVGRYGNSNSLEVLCGGSLISTRHVLSAANCFSNQIVLNVVILGEHNLSQDSENSVVVQIQDVKLADYNKATNENDIALVVLEKDVQFTDFIRPICLPMGNEVDRPQLANEMLTIVGWGTTNFLGEKSSMPLKALVPYVPQSQCSEAYKELLKNGIPETAICLGGNGKDSCQGDSGAPAVYRKGGSSKYFLAGISSFGVQCANPKFPGVYTYVPHYLDWILTNL